ncbi:hypothetical protein [Pseudomonas sp. Irchel 3A5]|uniref:hypothetical protein n=1 Tax=Pseudomonas sp. Irchel 3A5 TaxID=2008911 RepID=UPI000BA2C0F7|nr:hypothetical protein [Pseudomonas sp. Irchel 3A5]
MIKEIEKLMVHWGEQTRERGLGGGLGSQLGALIEWGGAPPRSTPGSRVLAGGTGLDEIATAIDRAVAQLQRTPGQAALARLATQRYCELVPVREQMRTAGIAEGADRTYRNWVQRLHEQVMSMVMASVSKRGMPSSK